MSKLSVDRLIIGFDRALRTISAQHRSSRPDPDAGIAETGLSDEEKRHAAGLMRVNHVGEICAQALYDAQGAFSQTPEVARELAHCGIEEEDHLAWTARRLKELNSRPSLLNPLWYAGAYTCGVIAAKCGDAASLGFVVETEKQVEAHLASHLSMLPQQDQKSRAIVEQMRVDEISHGATAQSLGASATPLPVRLLMKGMAKVMTSTAYHI